jgi:molybdopterin-biosynthesis enzyme MoeA-like protein
MLYTTAEVMWPTVVMRNVWLLPGVPEIFRMKLTVVRAWVRGQSPFVSKAVYTQLEEADLKPLIDAAAGAHPQVEIGSYPKWFDTTYKTKVTFDARDERSVEAAVAGFLATLPEGEPQRVQ